MSAETEPGGLEANNENGVLRANRARLCYLKEEIEVARELIQEAERSLKGLNDHLNDLTEEQAILKADPYAELDY